MSTLSPTASVIQTVATAGVFAASLYACINSPMSAVSRLLIPAASTAFAAVAFGFAAQHFYDNREAKDCSLKTCFTKPVLSLIGIAIGTSVAPMLSFNR